MTFSANSQPKVWTEKDLAIFDYVQTPMWVFEFETTAKWWANRAGLVLWKSPDNVAMRKRAMGSPVSQATILRLAAMRTRVERGEVWHDRWTYYPTGEIPFVAEVLFSGIYIADAEDAPSRLALLAEARPIGEHEMDPFYRRALEVLRHMGEMVSLYNPHGALLMRNPSAVLVLGDPSEFAPDADAFAQVFAAPVDAILAREELDKGPFRRIYEVHTKNGLAWHALDMRKVTDPVTGEVAVLVNHRDLTEHVRAQQELVQNREELAIQAEQLRRLASSPLRIWKNILALPLIGRIDQARIRSGLQGIQTRAATEEIRVVLLDLTGAEGVDGDAAEAIRQLIGSLALQGIRSRVVGVRATLARTLVGEGIDLGTVPLHASLAEALATELRR